MKVNLPVTQNEQHYPPEERLISETDLRGIITTANASFCQVCGFTEAELVGKSHNIVRHPDMPPEAFADLWRTVQAGERWVGVVKNRCKNGDYYWVKAFISPVVQDGKTVRYRSVRQQPSREEIAGAEALYTRLRGGEKGLINTLGAYRRRQRLGERLGVTGQLALVGGLPTLVALGLAGAATLGAPTGLLWAAAGAGAVATAAVAAAVHRWLNTGLNDLGAAISAFEHGDISARVEIHGTSRFAELARTMNRALDGVEVALADMGQVLSSQARGELGRRIVATLPGELGRIKDAANKSAEQIETTVGALNQQLAALAAGHLDVDQSSVTASTAGRFREAQENALMAATELSALLREIVESSRSMAEGDLTRPIRLDAAGELSVLCSHFNSALTALSETIVTVRTNAEHVARASEEISGAIEQIAAGAGSQMATVEQVSASARASGEVIARIAASTEFANTKSQETVASVSAGRGKMAQMVEVVRSIAAGSEQISQITEVIESIAKQTNMLALNAAIEAARAGQYGRGFAVVAQEVGTLANGASQSAHEIAALVSQAVSEARRAVQSVVEVSADMDGIEAAARESSELLARVTAAMGEQQATLQEIGRHAADLSIIAESNASATEELAASAAELARVAEGTYREADKFRTE